MHCCAGAYTLPHRVKLHISFTATLILCTALAKRCNPCLCFSAMCCSSLHSLVLPRMAQAVQQARVDSGGTLWHDPHPHHPHKAVTRPLASTPAAAAMPPMLPCMRMQHTKARYRRCSPMACPCLPTPCMLHRARTFRLACRMRIHTWQLPRMRWLWLCSSSSKQLCIPRAMPCRAYRRCKWVCHLRLLAWPCGRP